MRFCARRISKKRNAHRMDSLETIAGNRSGMQNPHLRWNIRNGGSCSGSRRTLFKRPILLDFPMATFYAVAGFVFPFQHPKDLQHADAKNRTTGWVMYPSTVPETPVFFGCRFSAFYRKEKTSGRKPKNDSITYCIQGNPILTKSRAMRFNLDSIRLNRKTENRISDYASPADPDNPNFPIRFLVFQSGLHL